MAKGGKGWQRVAKGSKVAKGGKGWQKVAKGGKKWQKWLWLGRQTLEKVAEVGKIGLSGRTRGKGGKSTFRVRETFCRRVSGICPWQ